MYYFQQIYFTNLYLQVQNIIIYIRVIYLDHLGMLLFIMTKVELEKISDAVYIFLLKDI